MNFWSEVAKNIEGKVEMFENIRNTVKIDTKLRETKLDDALCII